MNWVLYFLFIGFFITSNAQTRVHIVVDGDNIYKISRRYNISPRIIATVNEFKEINQPLFKYQQLIIPSKYYQVNSARDKYVEEIIHIVKEGESLYSISRIYEITVYDILLYNPKLIRGIPLKPNISLKIYASNNNKSQFSEQLIYLNGEQVKYDTFVFSDSLELYHRIEKIKSIQRNTINKILKSNTEKYKLILDTLKLPLNDNSRISKFIYNAVIHLDDSNYIKSSSDIDSLIKYILFYKSEILTQNSLKSDLSFKKNVFKLLNIYNQYHPSNDKIIAFRALLYFWIKDYKRALILQEEALNINKNNVIAQEILAAIFLEKKQYENAIYEFEAIQKKDTSNSRINYNLGLAYYYSLNPTKSLEFLLKVKVPVEIIPELYFKIANSFLLSENKENACIFLQKSINLDFIKAKEYFLKHCK